jgi:signal transduction histidine kinase
MPSLDGRLLQAGGTLLGATSVAAAAAAMGLYATSHSGTSEMVDGNGATNLVLGASLGVLGIILLRARPRNPLGWIVAGTGMANALTALGDAYAQHAFASPTPWHLGVFAAWLSSWAWVVGFVPAFTVLLARYPTGVPPSRIWRVVDRVGWSVTAAAAVGLALAREAFDDVAPARYAPFGETANQVAGVIFPLSLATGLAVGLVASIGTLVRLYRAASPVREQLTWLVVCIVPVTVSSVVAPSVVTLCLIPLVPLGIGLGILRYRLLDIQLVLRRTLLYGVLTATVVGIYIGVVAALTALVPHGPFPRLLAAAAIVVGIRPGYDVLRSAVDRYVYGDRHDPVRAVSRLGRELTRADRAEGPLPKAARAIAEALRVPYVRLATNDGDVIEHGTPSLPLHAVELHYGGAPVGTLSVARRTPQEPLRADDVALLELLAGPIGITVHATRLAAEVTVSRERLLEATEQERSRLRHDLHDGLGASLTGVGLGLEAAQLAAENPEALRPLLARLRAEVAESLTDVRRLVDGLRPPALDAAGLVDALRDHAATINARNAGALVVDVEAPLSVLALPKELEVAAYRITLEALTNVVRHADARHCAVRLRWSPEELQIEICDDGRGISVPSHPGVGLDSMRSRAAQLGGSVDVRRVPAGGTAVVARLPIGAR